MILILASNNLYLTTSLISRGKETLVKLNITGGNTSPCSTSTCKYKYPLECDSTDEGNWKMVYFLMTTSYLE